MSDNTGESLGKLDYLRGPHGQRDRETLWRGGLGTLAGTGEGGLKVDDDTQNRTGRGDSETAERRLDIGAARPALRPKQAANTRNRRQEAQDIN